MLNTDIRLFKAYVNTDTPANGGRVTANPLPSTGKGILPDLSQKERTAGLTRLRKVFFRNMNPSNEILYSPRVMLVNPSPAGDSITLVPGTPSDTQGTMTVGREYGGCNVTSGNVMAAATTIVCTLERSDVIPFVNGDTIAVGRLTKEGDYSDREYHDNVTVSATGTVLTITLEPGDQVSKDYSQIVDTTITVCSVYKHSVDMTPQIKNVQITSAAGTYNTATYPITGSNTGTVSDTITLTFTSPTNFNVSSMLKGSLGAGNITTNLTPVNSDFGGAICKVSSAGFGGVFVAGDTLSFDTVGADIALYYKQRVPAGTPSYKLSTVNWVVSGETL